MAAYGPHHLGHLVAQAFLIKALFFSLQNDLMALTEPPVVEETTLCLQSQTWE